MPPPPPISTLSVRPVAGGDEHLLHDLVCGVCGGTDRMHPAESWVGQVLIFLDQHRH